MKVLGILLLFVSFICFFFLEKDGHGFSALLSVLGTLSIFSDYFNKNNYKKKPVQKVKTQTKKSGFRKMLEEQRIKKGSKEEKEIAEFYSIEEEDDEEDYNSSLEEKAFWDSYRKNHSSFSNDLENSNNDQNNDLNEASGRGFPSSFTSQSSSRNDENDYGGGSNSSDYSSGSSSSSDSSSFD